MDVMARLQIIVPPIGSKMEKLASNPEDQSRGTVIGEFENSVDIASLQMTYSF